LNYAVFQVLSIHMESIVQVTAQDDPFFREGTQRLMLLANSYQVRREGLTTDY
jgi:hypothetical protein